MREEHLFDEIARLLASPMPRRRAFRLILQSVGGAALVALGARPALAACDPPCGANLQCCTVGGGGFCAPTALICCGGGTCNPSTQQCCTLNGVPQCVSKD